MIWLCFLTTPMDLTLKFQVQGQRGVIDMEQDGYESIVPDHDCDLWVTMMG